MIWNIISLIGFIVGVIGTAAGIIGTIISYKTMVNTKKIENALEVERVKFMFKSEYRLITSKLATNISFLTQKDIRRETITEIKQIVKKVKKYSDDQNWNSKAAINNCDEFINKNFNDLLSNLTIKEGKKYTLPNEELNNELIRLLLEVQSAVEKEMYIYDIR